MSSASAAVLADNEAMLDENNQQEFITMTISGQLFGLPVLSVQDVLGPQRITRIPLAPREVAGALNLRGRVVTAIDVRMCLGMEPQDADHKSMSVVVEHHGELYSFIIDAVGEVLSPSFETFEPNPSTMDAHWRSLSKGIFRLEDQLLVILDITSVLDFRGDPVVELGRV